MDSRYHTELALLIDRLPLGRWFVAVSSLGFSLIFLQSFDKLLA
jgi:hypothetical protein